MFVCSFQVNARHELIKEFEQNLHEMEKHRQHIRVNDVPEWCRAAIPSKQLMDMLLEQYGQWAAKNTEKVREEQGLMKQQQRNDTNPFCFVSNFLICFECFFQEFALIRKEWTPIWEEWKQSYGQWNLAATNLEKKLRKIRRRIRAHS